MSTAHKYPYLPFLSALPEKGAPYDGVEGETRTPTGVSPLEPESSASTNSATPTFFRNGEHCSNPGEIWQEPRDHLDSKNVVSARRNPWDQRGYRPEV